MLAPARGITPEALEAMVQKVLEAQQPAPTAAEAYESILPSVVHVRGLPDAPDADVASGRETQSGTGVVIVDTGVILTNLHVVHGSKAIKIVFHDGLESDAVVIGMQPEQDLAVLQAKTIPDDLMAATLRSTQGLRPGEPVIAVGFPFGIGPSVSTGVISGLGREYQNRRRQAHPHQPDPVRRRGEPGQLRRAADHAGRRGHRHRHRAAQSHRAPRVHRHRLRRADRERGGGRGVISFLGVYGQSRKRRHPHGAHPL